MTSAPTNSKHVISNAETTVFSSSYGQKVSYSESVAKQQERKGKSLAMPICPTTIISFLLLLPLCVAGFIGNHDSSPPRAFLMSESNVNAKSRLDPAVAEKFKILTCSSTSCAQKRKVCGLDEFATFGAFYSRIKHGNAPDVQLEESPCLGSCKMSPCVAIQHEDFIGNVALEGMTGNEFIERV